MSCHKTKTSTLLTILNKSDYEQLKNFSLLLSTDHDQLTYCKMVVTDLMAERKGIGIDASLRGNSNTPSSSSTQSETDSNDSKFSPYERQKDTSLHTERTCVTLSEHISGDDLDFNLEFTEIWDHDSLPLINEAPSLDNLPESYTIDNLPHYAIVIGSKNHKHFEFGATPTYRGLRTTHTPLEVMYYKLVSHFQQELSSNKYGPIVPMHEDQLLFVTAVKDQGSKTYKFLPLNHDERNERLHKDKENGTSIKPTLEDEIECLHILTQSKRRTLFGMSTTTPVHPKYEAYAPTVEKVLESIEVAINNGIADAEDAKKHRTLLKNTWELYFPSPPVVPKPRKKRNIDKSTGSDNDNVTSDSNNSAHHNGNNGMPDQSNSDTHGNGPSSFFGDQGGGYTGGGYTGHAMSNYDKLCSASDICDESSTESSLSPWKYDSSSDDEDADNGDDDNDNGGDGISLIKSDDETTSTTIVQFQPLEILPSEQSGDAISSIVIESEQSIAADIIISNSVSERADLTIEISKQFIDTDDIMLLNDMKISKTDSNSTKQQQQEFKHISDQVLPKPIVAHLDEVRPGVDNGIGYDGKNKNGKEFMKAAIEGNLDKIKEYVNNGVDPNAKTINGSTVLHYASKNGRLDVLRYLIQYCNVDPNAKTNDGSTVLHYASIFGHLNVLRFLMQDCNVDPDAKTNDGWNVLYLASFCGRLDVLRYLIQDCNVDPNAKTNDGSTVLHFASMFGHLDVLRYLIQDCNVDPNAKTNDGYNVLHYASENGHLDVLRYLIQDCNVDPNAKTDDGSTVLHCASRRGHLDVLRYLIQDCNVDKEAKDIFGQTAYDLAPDIYTRIDGKLNVRESEDSDVANYSKKLNTDKEAKDMYGRRAFDLAPHIYTRIDGKLNRKESEDSDVANYSKKLNTDTTTITTTEKKNRFQWTVNRPRWLKKK